MKEKKKMMVAIALVVLLGILILAIVISSNGSSIKVTFDSHGGTEVESLKIKKGETIEEPDKPLKEGYEFIGWYYDGKKFDFSKKIDENIELEAKWLKVGTIKNTVTFDSAGGSSVEAQQLSKGEKAKKPANPTRSGYTFVEWTLDGKSYDFDKVVEKSIKLVAVWKQNTVAKVTSTNKNATAINTVKKPTEPTPVVVTNVYKVTFYNDGIAIYSFDVEEGKFVTPPAEPTKENYIFSGWQYAGNVYDFTLPVTEDMAIEAIWTPVLRTSEVVSASKLNTGTITRDTTNQTAVELTSGINQIIITKKAPVQSISYDTTVAQSSWVALSFDLGRRPTTVDVTNDVTVVETTPTTTPEIAKIDEELNEDDTTDFIVWVDVDAYKEPKTLVFKDDEGVIGKVLVVTDYEKMELKSVEAAENSTVEVVLLENTITVTELPSAVPSYKLVFDLEIDPTYIKVNGQAVNSSDMIAGTTKFIVTIGTTTPEEITFTSTIDDEDLLKITKTFVPVVLTDEYTAVVGTVVVDQSVSKYVTYDATTKKFTVKATITEFTFTDDGKVMNALKVKEQDSDTYKWVFTEDTTGTI